MATTVVKNAGYLASAASIAFSGTQQINSLTDNEYTDLSDEVDNTTNLYKAADFELVLSSAAFTGADSGIELYIIPTVDGTNYPSWTGNVTSDETENLVFFEAFSPTTASTAAQRMIFRDIPLPQGKWKAAIRNRGNVTLAGSGNTLSFRPHSLQGVS